MSITEWLLRRVGLCVCLPTFDLFTGRTSVFRMHAEVRPYAILSIMGRVNRTLFGSD